MNSTCMTKLGFELAYLTQLTQAGLKPLSRWESRFDETSRRTLETAGLKTRVVERSVRSGKRVRELIFSPSDACLDLYAGSFDGTAIRRDTASMRLEGRLFGYPACCVESFLTRPYAKNSLRRADQRILFHWACPGCAVTPRLLPEYRRIYQQCRQLHRQRLVRAAVQCSAAGVASVRRTAVLAASLLALGASPAMAQIDPHWLPPGSGEDPDADYLTTVEEIILGKNPAQPDENGNGVPDGVDLAQAMSAALELLPTAPSASQPYLEHHLTWGLESCEVCGAVTNMGLMVVVNPLENQTVSIPYIAKHFLDHGSFSYSGTEHAGRINPPLLQMALTSSGLGHFISEAPEKDADDDGLRNAEEPAFQTQAAARDTDGNLIIDGIDQARALRAQLDTLPRASSPETGPKDRPFVVEHPMDGVETCPRCGESVVMDVWDVINPVTGARLTVPSMALHYLRHGGFGWQGGQLMGGAGRVDPRQLQAVLTGQGGRHLVAVTPDPDGDLLTDAEELDLGTDGQKGDEDNNQVQDGVDLARDMAGEIALLPTLPSTNQVYRRDFPLRGLEQCAMCGTNVNMGHLTVCNPMAGLYAKVPYIELHFLEHGSFSFAGDVHGQGRAAVKLLVDALRSSGPSHRLPLAQDVDGDGLLDNEEPRLGTNPTLPDTDGDGVPDGFALARELWQAAGALPRTANDTCYAVEQSANGLEACNVCGKMVNMGYVEVINPRQQTTLELPYLALHFLEHGSFAYGPTERIDPVQLEAILRPPLRIAITAGQVTVCWIGWPDRTYQLYTAAQVAGPWTAGPVFHGDGSELTFTEPQSANGPDKFYKVVVW